MTHNELREFYMSQAYLVHDPVFRRHINQTVVQAFGTSSIGTPEGIIPSVRPIPFTGSKENIATILKEEYWLHGKTSGVEMYIVFTTFQEKHFVVAIVPSQAALNWECWVVAGISASEHIFKNTIIKGTATWANDKAVFVCADLIQMSGYWDLPKRTFSNRMRMLGQFLPTVEYRHEAAAAAVDDNNKEAIPPPAPFTMVIQSYAPVNSSVRCKDLVNTIGSDNGHYQCSGIMLTPEKSGILLGIHPSLFSWEPACNFTRYLFCTIIGDRVLLHGLSLSLDNKRVCIAEQSITDTMSSSIFVNDNDNDDDDGDLPDEQSFEDACTPITKVILTQDLWMYRHKLQQIHNSMVECFWNTERHLWHFRRLAPHKSHPSELSLIQQTQASIASIASADDLLNCIFLKS